MHDVVCLGFGVTQDLLAQNCAGLKPEKLLEFRVIEDVLGGSGSYDFKRAIGNVICERLWYLSAVFLNKTDSVLTANSATISSLQDALVGNNDVNDSPEELVRQV